MHDIILFKKIVVPRDNKANESDVICTNYKYLT